MSSESFVIQLSAGGEGGFYEVPFTVCEGRGNVPRVRAKRIKKRKLLSMDQSPSRLAERTAKMMVASLLLSCIWAFASGNSLSVCLSFCCNSFRDHGGPASRLLCC